MNILLTTADGSEWLLNEELRDKLWDDFTKTQLYKEGAVADADFVKWLLDKGQRYWLLAHARLIYPSPRMSQLLQVVDDLMLANIKLKLERET